MSKSKLKFFAIVPAAGTGSRMKSVLPKQFLNIDGYPLLYHTLTSLLDSQEFEKIVVATDTEFLSNNLFEGNINNEIDDILSFCSGGTNRMLSVSNALQNLQGIASGDDWIFVHDAARVGILPSDIHSLQNYIKSYNPEGAIFSIPVVDSIKSVNKNGTIEKSINRKHYWLAQTPQCFRYKDLQSSLRQLSNEIDNTDRYTDESSCMEKFGFMADVVEGSADNFKVTFPNDLNRMANIIQLQVNNGLRSHPQKYFNL